MGTLVLAPAATSIDWTIITGSDSYTIVVPVLDADSIPVAVDGWTVKTQARRSAADPVLYEWSTTAGNASCSGTQVNLTVDAAVTASWAWSDAHISVVVTDLSGKPHCIASGTIHALPDITQVVNDPTEPDSPALVGWRTALAARQTTPVDILLIGDSITEYQGATARSSGWGDRLLAYVRAEYPTPGIAGGQGFIGATQFETSWPSGWTNGSSTTPTSAYGLAQRSVLLGDTNGTITRTVFGTSVTVHYSTRSDLGSFQVFLDGSGTAAATVNTATGASGVLHDGGRVTVSLGTRGSHTVKIGWSAGGAAAVNGVHIFDQDETAGIRLLSCGLNGATSAVWSPVTNTALLIADDIALIRPALVIIELGEDDRLQNLTPTAYLANIKALVALIRTASPTSSISLLAAYNLAGSYTYPWSAYVAQMQSLVASDGNLAFSDLSETDPVTAAAMYGLNDTDGLHPSDAGHDLIAQTVAAHILPA